MLRRIRRWDRRRAAFIILPVLALLLAIPLTAAAYGGSGPLSGRLGGQATVEGCERLQERDFTRALSFIERLVDEEIVDAGQSELIGDELREAVYQGCIGRVLLSPRDAFEITADLAGTTTMDVWFSVLGGESLATYASEHGSSPEALVAALLGAARAQADELVAAGELDQATADSVLQQMEEKLPELVEKSPRIGDLLQRLLN